MAARLNARNVIEEDMKGNIKAIDVSVSPFFFKEKIELWKKSDSYVYGAQLLTKGANIFKDTEDLIEEMDQNGIEKAIISGSQSDYLFTSNDWIAEQVRKYRTDCTDALPLILRKGWSLSVSLKDQSKNWD